MRRIVLCALVVAAIAGVFASFCMAADQSVDGLKTRLANAPEKDRVEISLHIAEQQLGNADTFYKQGRVAEGQAALDDVVAYSEKASESAIATRKHSKNVEIATRKMAERLRDMKHAIAFEDQPPVDEAIRRLENVRTAMLQEMFSGKKENKK
jgi:hypothetical protein